MTTYKIEIQEHLSRVIEIEAPSAEAAIDKVRAMYRAEEIVLDGDDCVATEIEEFTD
ncbi:MAG: DpnD/PcfM family protein [Dysgonamonadaceae bacterium]|nr:DpnD/PcfM family protein [Dysgonamonadaceae bacterium]MDD4727700.1 DpnD/PcfM family protein [Dysgonamonadaceae bacterium]